jgi:hypothetical protein
MSARKRVLVVAHRTADSADLIAALRRRHARTPTGLTLLVPAVPRGFAWAADMKSGWAEAIARAEAAARRMRAAGLELDGVVVGDPDPFAAAGDVLHEGSFDEVIVSALPHSVSRWLRLSLPDRLRRAFAVPVTQVIAHPSTRRAPVRRREAVGAVEV